MPIPLTTRFEAGTLEHLGLIGLFAVGLVAWVLWGRRHRGTGGEQTARRTFAVVLGAVGAGMQTYQLTPGDFSVRTSLPLALCDLALVSAVVALWTRGPRATAFTYYVGLTLTIQGVLTPSLGETFPHPRYFGFWALHFGVVWAAAYLTWGLGQRPDWRLFRFAALLTGGWAVATYLFNLAAGTNYGYLNRKPPSASVLDLLGPWPWYVLAEIALVLAGWALLLTLPWTLLARRGEARTPTGTAAGSGP